MVLGWPVCISYSPTLWLSFVSVEPSSATFSLKHFFNITLWLFICSFFFGCARSWLQRGIWFTDWGFSQALCIECGVPSPGPPEAPVLFFINASCVPDPVRQCSVYCVSADVCSLSLENTVTPTCWNTTKHQAQSPVDEYLVVYFSSSN